MLEREAPCPIEIWRPQLLSNTKGNFFIFTPLFIFLFLYFPILVSLHLDANLNDLWEV